MNTSRHILLAVLLSASTVVAAQDRELNLYSARHYQTDEALYANFTRQTGIKINRIDAGENELLERLRNEGANSPADVFITVDAARLAQADELSLFAPHQSKLLEARVPAHLRTPTWVAFSTRARVLLVARNAVNPATLQTYQDLALPVFKGKVCARSGAHPYNLSLGASLVAHQGEQLTADWARGLVANFGRAPKGGDSDQIRAVAAGECAIALVNTYYVARFMRSDKAEDRKMMEGLAVIWPNQKTTGTHINVSGGGMLRHAPHKQAAVRFLEYLASDTAQVHFADGNNEWPVVPGVKVDNPALNALGSFKADTLPIGSLARHQATVQKIYDRSGWR